MYWGETGYIDEDLAGHLSVAVNKKAKDFNAECLRVILCVWVDCRNWHLAPRSAADCFENTEAKVDQSFEPYRALLSVIADSVAWISGDKFLLSTGRVKSASRGSGAKN